MADSSANRPGFFWLFGSEVFSFEIFSLQKEQKQLSKDTCRAAWGLRHFLDKIDDLHNYLDGVVIIKFSCRPLRKSSR